MCLLFKINWFKRKAEDIYVSLLHVFSGLCFQKEESRRLLTQATHRLLVLMCYTKTHDFDNGGLATDKDS